MTVHVSAQDLKHCEQQLLERRGALRNELLEAARATAGADQRLPGAEVHDWKDDAFADLVANVRSTELAHVREELAAIQGALQRIAGGTYGSCTECGKAISHDRLMVQPSAGRCLHCQEGQEKPRTPRAAPTAATPPRR